MSERINKLILETEFKSTGDISPSVQKIDALTKAAKAATGNTLQLVEAEKKLEQAAAQAGVAVSTETKKQTEFAKAVQGTSKAMKEITSTNDLKKAFAGSSTEVANVTKELEKFKTAARAAKNVDELTESINELMLALPEDIRADAFKLIEKESAQLAKTIERPTARLRELKRLINTTDDPVLLKKLTAEAAKLQDELGDTNDLIKSLASDTLFTDTLVQGAQTATAAFSAFQGVTTLFAEDNEELARAAQKAQGAMSALLGIQQLSIELKRKDNIVTKAQTLAQRGYALVVGQSTGAMKGFKLALAATGIGLAVVALIALVQNFDKVKYALGFGVNPETERYIELTKKAVQAAQDEIEAFEGQAEAMRNLADKRKLLNEDILQGEIDRSNAEINILNQESEKRLVKSNELIAQVEAEEKKLIEIAARKEKALAALESQRNSASPSLRDAANRPERIELINEQFAAELAAQEKVISDLEQQNIALFNQTQSADNKIIELGKQKTESVKKNLDKQNDDRLASLQEDERHALAEASILKKSEEDILKIQLDFANRRKDLLNKIGGQSPSSIKRIENEIKELELAISKLKPQDIEVFTPGSLDALNKQAQDLRKIIDSLPEGPELLEKAEALRIVQAEIQRLGEIIAGPQAAEDKRTSLLEILDEDERYQLASLGIAEETEQKKLALQIKFQKERLEFLRASGEEVSDVELMRAENDLKLLEEQYAKSNETIKKSNRELVAFLVDGFSQVISAAANAAQTIVSIEQDKYDRLTDLQKQRVSDAEKIADRGNATVLEAEQKRLDELNKKNEEFAQKQIAIAQIQLVAESALAIAKAAAQGGAGAAFTIAAVLIAIAAGFAQARAQSQAVAASFREGGYTGDGDPSQESKAIGPRNYKYHKKEYVMPEPVVSLGNNKDWFKRIHNERIDLDKLLGIKQPNVIVQNKPPESQTAIYQQFNLNSAGIISIKEKHEKLQAKREYLKNWKRKA